MERDGDCASSASANTIEREAKRGLELWAGIECTVNRVGNRVFDQVKRTGHDSRIEDLERFAELGIAAIRYPILWEHTAPDGLESADWSWSRERLERLRSLGVRPIVGLVHHGSGPFSTNLLDPGFPEGLARFAQALAERYPWVESYTPVNEPLTTARFSGLYGHWYPHARSNLAFATALLTECRAVVLAMQAIRKVRPDAQLVQTEDAARTFSTPSLAYQAEWENERRWLTFDLLCGKVNREHPMWGFLCWAGIEEDALKWFLDNICPPDIIGLNYYLTGERFLDEHLKRYPQHLHGGNGRDKYADVEAVRVRAEGLYGPYRLLREAWERYGLPTAFTEAHNGCTREEQLRWLNELWSAAERLRGEGADVRAVTVWSLLGAYDWDSLVTEVRDHYEPGVFDLRAPEPRATALAGLMRELASGREPSHPTLEAPGWWRRPVRLCYGFSVSENGASIRNAWRMKSEQWRTSAQPLLITGATGTLGRAFALICEQRGLAHRLVTRAEMDIANVGEVRALLARYKPWAVVNTAGYVRVDDAEREQEACFRENTTGPAVLAVACAEKGVRLVTFSSDLVFDGALNRAYVESDGVAPLGVYGQSKAEAEEQTLAELPAALVVRTSAFFGPGDDYNFVTNTLRALAQGNAVHTTNGCTVSPTYVPDLVNASLDLLVDGEEGIWHLANNGATTWVELGRRIAEMAGLDPGLVVARPVSEMGWVAKRPAYSVLGSERGTPLPTLEDALRRYLEEADAVRELRRGTRLA